MRFDLRRVGMPREGMVKMLGWLTLLVFGGAGILLIYFQKRHLLQVLIGEGDILLQVIMGVFAGLFIGVAAWAIIQFPFMRPIRLRYSNMIGPLMSRRSDRLFVSLCAGVGEELFFRGALQYWFGIVITAVLFVAIHGYLDPRSWRISVYGVSMTFGMLLLGWMAQRFGLLAPIIAHTLIDVVLLERLNSEWRRRQNRAPGIQS